MAQRRFHRTVTKLFVVVGIAATIGVSVAIHAASLSAIPTSTTLKGIIAPISPTTKAPAKTIPSTAPAKEIAPITPVTGITPTQTKTIAPNLATPTPSPSPQTSTKEITKPLTTTDTKQPITKKLPSITTPDISKILPTTKLPGSIEVPLKTTVTPLLKIAPLSPETTPFITIPLKDSTKNPAITPLKIPESTPTGTKEFIITTPLQNLRSIPLLPPAPEKNPETTIIIKTTADTQKNPEPGGKIPTLDITRQPDSSINDVSESNSAYQAISDMIALMTKQGNYASPKSKKFRPKNKTRWPFAIQLALSLSGDACGLGKGGTRQAACLSKAVELGLVNKNKAINKPMTKGEFYELILQALKMPAVEPAGDMVCLDVDATHEFANVIATAKYYGITKRYQYKGEGGYCLPDAPLTKADAAVIAAKALEVKKSLQP